jgi:uncharacterized protein
VADPSSERGAKLGEAPPRAKLADSRYAAFMTQTAAFAPHLGAAIAAGLLICSGLAFQAGAEGAVMRLEDSLGGLAVSGDAQTATSSVARIANREIVPIPTEYTSSFDGTVTTVQDAGDGLSQPPTLAIIIDDVGLDRTSTERLLALDIPLTLAFLPYADATPELALAARAAGKDVFLHLPMEPVGLDDPGPHALARHLTADQIGERVRWALARVPGATGFNNHMGSRLTSDAGAMDALFAPLSGQGLVFVDSLTSSESVAGDRAAQAGLRAYRRDVFLDHEIDEEAIDSALSDALSRARETGSAIAIGHPHSLTLAALEGLGARAAREGVQLVTIRDLAARES